MSELGSHAAWDRATRWFHWINFLCVLALIALGLFIYFASAFEISNGGKALLKTVHVWVGYLFALNLLWRIVQGFIGGAGARWGAVLPRGPRFAAALGDYLGSLRSGEPRHYVGRSPASRLAATVLLLVLLVQALTGLVIAGTDVFMPPFGGMIAEWIAAPGVDPATLVPYAPELYDPAAVEQMRAFRKPFVTVHLYNFWLLLALIAGHVAAVVVVETKGGGVIGAMFSGRKVFAGRPADEER